MRSWRWTPRFKPTERLGSGYNMTTPVPVTFNISIHQIEMEVTRMFYDKLIEFRNKGGVGFPEVISISPSDIYSSIRSSLLDTGTVWTIISDESNFEDVTWSEQRSLESCRRLFPSAYRNTRE